MPLSFLFCFSFLVCRVCFVSAVPRRKDFVSPGVNARRAVLDDVTAVDAWRRQRTRLTRTDRMVCACVRDESPANERSILRYINIFWPIEKKKNGDHFLKKYFSSSPSLFMDDVNKLFKGGLVCVCVWRVDIDVGRTDMTGDDAESFHSLSRVWGIFIDTFFSSANVFSVRHQLCVHTEIENETKGRVL